MAGPLPPDQVAAAARPLDPSPSASAPFDSISEGGPVEPGRLLFGKYLLVRKLGEGGMGEVWLVRHHDLDVERALKLIVASVAFNREIRARFRREAWVMARFSHPNAVAVHDAVIRPGGNAAYIEMEYVRGQSLNKVLKPGVPMPLDWIARIVAQLCAVLQVAHEKGIVHRDLKPSNLMLLDGQPPGQEHLKILDFGIAKILGSDQQDQEPLVTRTGMPVGTPQYMSPEQIVANPGEVDARSDIYSVGLILYEMLTGHRPFASTLPKLIHDQLETPPPPFAAKRPDSKVPPEVERLVLRCLEKDPARRPQSARELADAFREALNRSSLAAPVPLARRYRRWIALGALLLIGLASLLAALHQLFGLADQPAPTPAGDMTARQSGSAPPDRAGPAVPEAERISWQLRAWARQGYRPDTAGGTSKGWPAILIRAEDGVRFHWSVGGIYLPNGYSPGTEADPVDGWPKFLVRKDGVAFLRVAGGTFTMGCLDEAVIPADDPTRPAHPVSLSGFYMQKTEVTNGEIEPYIMSIGRGVCPGWERRFEKMMLELGAELARKHPATGIPWTVARDYARKKLGRLPTEAQWEFAARSRGKEYHYVWDGRGERSEPFTQLANIDNLGPNPFGTVAVGCYPIDVTEQGILDLTGNVREWCRDAWRPYEQQAEPVIDPQFSPDLDGWAEVRLVVRGGSFQSSPDAGRTTSRGEPLDPGDRAVPTDVGFRLVIECPDRAPVLGR